MSRLSGSHRRRLRRRRQRFLARGESYCVPALEHLEERRLLAVNLAPVNNVPTVEQVTLVNEPLAFTAFRGNEISISDPDADVNHVQITLSVPDVNGNPAGLVTLVSKDRLPAGRLTFIAGDGELDSVVTVQGTVDDLNVALSWVSFTPEAGFQGTADIILLTDDLGSTGTGGAQQDTDVIQVAVSPANNNFRSSPAWATTPSALDPSFDDDGKLVFGEPAGIDYIDQMQLLPGGGIIAGGISGDEVALFRFLPDLSLDSSFGVGGTLKTGFTDVIRPGTILEVEEGSVGCYLVGGGSRLFRYLPDGTVDGSFGQGGSGFVDFGSGQGFWDLDFEADGQILVVNDAGVFRLSPDGASLNLLATGNFRGVKARDHGELLVVEADLGVRVYSNDASQVNFFTGVSGATSTMLELPDENVLVVGATALGDILLSRHLSSGPLDTSFGNSGAVSLTITGRSDLGYRATLQP
ncbi:MAG: hypothetical protein QGH11_08015, partial [Pirellulaceae bacterium]|nr:hypothetical protein [Pirellulaceae bacterium]